MPGDPPSYKKRWRWCKNCQGLHFVSADGSSHRICPAPQPRGQNPPALVIGPHSVLGSGEYVLALHNAQGYFL
jgi:hypothetical protein